MDLRNGFDIRRYIRTIPDYPKPGIQFRDITTLLANKHAFRAAVDELMWPFLSAGVDYVAGIEARGFILGGAIAHELGLGFRADPQEGQAAGQDHWPRLPAGIRR
jgi:adenine phosphoribosyltransferase